VNFRDDFNPFLRTVGATNKKGAKSVEKTRSRFVVGHPWGDFRFSGFLS